MSRPHFSSKWWLGLCLIFFIYSLYYLVLYETTWYQQVVPRKIRHVLLFLITLSVYLVGTSFLGKIKYAWMGQLWHLVHISGMCFLVAMGIFDWLIGGIRSIPPKQVILSVQEFLVSPTLYVAMGLLNSRLFPENPAAHQSNI